MRIKSKNILITGVSTGIGYDLSKVFLNDGYTVFGSVRKKADADRLSKEFGKNFTPLIFDVTDHDAVDKAAQWLESVIGNEGLGGLINNAGIAVGGALIDLGIKEYRHQFEVNVIGLVKVTQAFLPLLGAGGKGSATPGRIIQISSVSGKIGMPFMSPYTSSKHAVEGLTESLRRELMLFGIKVIVIGPGAIQTPIWHKNISEDKDKKFARSHFATSIRIFQNSYVKKAIKNGWTSEKLAKMILNIFEKKNPKRRYALVPSWFKSWILPRMLPPDLVDKIISKSLKLTPKTKL